MSSQEARFAVVLLVVAAGAGCTAHVPADPCAGQGCSGHGRCEVRLGDPLCLCADGFHAEGLACLPDEGTPCEGVDCAGHGSCSLSGGEAECLCDEGFHAEGLECVEDPCVPECGGLECGPDPRCGESCGSCATGDRCRVGACMAGAWVLVDAGTFPMGSPLGEFGRFEEPEQQHEVTLTRAFAVLSTEVTQKEFEASMGYAPSPRECPRCPAEPITWWEAAAFSNELSLEEGLPACYECRGSGPDVECELAGVYRTPYECPGYRLPTEAEWEYAARAGTTTATYVGDFEFGGDLERCVEVPELSPIAWYCGNSGREPHEVGLLEPNPWGLHDALGNAAEWTHDRYYGLLGTAPVTDPWVWDEPPTADLRVTRGASFLDYTVLVRAATRWPLNAPPDYRGRGIGLRPVRTVEE